MVSQLAKSATDGRLAVETCNRRSAGAHNTDAAGCMSGSGPAGATWLLLLGRLHKWDVGTSMSVQPSWRIIVAYARFRTVRAAMRWS